MTDQPMPAECATELGHKELRRDAPVQMLGWLMAITALVAAGAALYAVVG